MSLQHIVSKASTELHVVVKWHKIRIMKFTKVNEFHKDSHYTYIKHATLNDLPEVHVV